MKTTWKSGALFAVLVTPLFLTLHLNADTESGSSGGIQLDYSKNALPILKQNCFACHGPNPQSTDGLDPDLKKKANKIIAKAQADFPMGEDFPFPGSTDPGKDLKDLMKVLKKGSMPPHMAKSMNLGSTLSDSDKMNLSQWVGRALKEIQ